MHNRITSKFGLSSSCRTSFPLVAGSLLLVSAMMGCTAHSNRIAVQRWGAMRETLRDGRTEGRVRLTDFEGVDGAMAVGALEGLSGEVLILDGDVWLSRVNDLGVAKTTRGALQHERATLLTAACVTQWQEIPIDKDVPASAIENFLVDAARDAGFDPKDPVPFMVTGTLMDLELHVIAGACPLAASQGQAERTLRQPFRKSFATSSSKLVGFLVEGQEGVLTHHGSKMHTHALVGIDPPIMGHVDRVGIATGCVLYLPEP